MPTDPARRVLPGLMPRVIGRELLAGVTLIAIAVPLNIGYAQIAGLPATAGLYALIIPTVVYALTVSSRQLVASPDAAAAALVASSIGGLAVAGSADYATLAMAQAIIGGILFLLLAFFKLGFVANFLSKPILIGFVGGLAFDILVSQIAKMLGIPIDSGSEILDKVTQLLAGLPSANVWSILIALASIVVLIAGRRLLPGVPWALVVLVVATAVVMLTPAEEAGVDVLGEVPAGLPTLTWPVLDWSTWLALVPSAIALTLVTTAEGLLVSRAYGEKRGYRTRPNRDLLAFGLGNIASGASASFTMGSSTSRTAAMDQAGSRTQLPSLVLAAGTLLLLLFGTALLADIPSPAIGAIVAVAILPLLGIRELASLWRLDRFEFVIAAVCFLVTLFVGAIPGILVSFVLALVNLVQRASHPAIDVLASTGDPGESLLEDAPRGSVTGPGVIVVRLAAPLFFANGAVFQEAVTDAVRAAGGDDVHHVVLDMEAVTDIDVTGAESFETLDRWLAAHSVAVAFTRLRPPIGERMRRLGILRDQQIFGTNRAALAALTTPETTTEREEHP